MRKFIISDIHGLGSLYYGIMNYLDNISEYEEVELYINGDLIDRGNESAEILLDVIKRIKENNPRFKIEYLGGNHELMMYNVFNKRKKNIYVSDKDDWFFDGGHVTDDGLSKLLNGDKRKLYEIGDFIGNLNIYHRFKEEIKDKPIVLIHAACPKHVKKKCDLKIKDGGFNTFVSTWLREDPFLSDAYPIGNDKYFTIIGHTPVTDKEGYNYNSIGNYLNIDGGSSLYVQGLHDFNHFPLVEIKDGFLNILTFNADGKIIYGNYFDGNISVSYSERDMAQAIGNPKTKTKKIQ